MASPTSISAVESKDISILYYTRSGGQIASLTSQKSGEDPKNPEYVTANVMLGGNTVSAAAPQVTAVAYTLNDSREIRLYYIDGNDQDGYQLKELCKTNDGDWYDGTLNDNGVTATKDSLLAANVEDGQGDLKVFFQRQKGGNKDTWVAWVVLGQTTWSQRKVYSGTY
ncbi:hypothetical protein DL766_000191 [Monosporascus sp. MC13-8B]|uniref:Fucose-specific lectin n=1 Tax=Monosporascus cannonballus TaxID=155416 RepID=A0ABY0H2V7_9PEZI|nr:hypothetical protein DL763_011044 [Monosporascus cannonballus]RYO82595.1 hypothetical protein DL762_006549 [Monosporascus cannonballus]RYP39749.1 hypothetical protein DL766_000191 [Monosporascus sp. MC13-8B]